MLKCAARNFTLFRTTSDTVVCFGNVCARSCLLKRLCLVRTGVSQLADIPRKPERWPHKRCDRRCLPDSWHTEHALQNNLILATAVVFSLHGPSVPYRVFGKSSCYPNEPDLTFSYWLSHQHSDPPTPTHTQFFRLAKSSKLFWTFLQKSR